MIERYLLGRVQHQFGEPQDQPNNNYVAVFSRTMSQVSWGQYIPASEVVDSFRHLVARPWAYDQGLADPGMTHT